MSSISFGLTVAWPGRRLDARIWVSDEDLERPEAHLENEKSLVCDI
jgi:hypothetical protein